MGLTTKQILSIPITIDPKVKVLEEIRKWYKTWKVQSSKPQKSTIKPLVIYTPNPEIITYAQHDKEYKRIITSAQISLPDGAGIIWALQYLYHIKLDRIAGSDFLLELVRMAQEKSIRIGLIGGWDNVALKVRECLLNQYPRLKISVLEAPEIYVSSMKYHVSSIKKSPLRNTNYLILNPMGTQPPDTEKYFQDLINEINQKKIGMLFVALGHPKQEYFIHNLKLRTQNSKLRNPLILMGVGGAFDYIAGRVPRAPGWMREGGLEWLYRLLKQPWRIQRQIRGSAFFWNVLKSG